MKRFSIPPGLSTASIWVVWAILAAGALGWSFFVVLDAFDLKKDAAAWLQAVGGIAAVFAAFYVGNKQARDAVAARHQRQVVVFQLVCSVADRAASASHLLFQSFNDMQSSDTALNAEIITTVEAQLMALNGISPVDLPLPDMVEPFLVIRGALEQSVVFARLLSDGSQKDVMRCATVFSKNSQLISISARKLAQMELGKR
ncbi:hypothetical protein [Pseudomonas gingeri]|uniref:Uncharacterized protein n=1 Tax=Pseudomonas gingeri TaxID=117681 RepID=A0A7Y7YIC1_9PSED|nr:hypothetical protein [Pseudomonas gingeri]NWB30689.1 hypothetical protein [Pseudomonas gingeri]NWC36986.1 hypothetical protein [Pseudomonas gingeri]